MLNLIDEFTHECPAIRVDRKLEVRPHVIDVLSDQFILRGGARTHPIRCKAAIGNRNVQRREVLAIQVSDEVRRA